MQRLYALATNVTTCIFLLLPINDYCLTFQKYCNEYVKWVEEALAEALTTYQKPTDDDGGYVRQSSVKYVI